MGIENGRDHRNETWKIFLMNNIRELFFKRFDRKETLYEFRELQQR